MSGPGSFPMDMGAPHSPPPPHDIATRERIDKMAEYIIRNGPQFETMMREKQRGNSEFAFLYGGPHSDYFRYALYCLSQPRQGPPGFTIQEQSEIEGILNSLNRTKDSIRMAKEWILSHSHCSDAITGRLRFAAQSATNFDDKLNVVYLVSDVIFHCSTMQGSSPMEVTRALKGGLVFILREATLTFPPELQEKCFKVVDLWQQRQIFDNHFINMLKDGMTNPTAPIEYPTAPVTAPPPAPPPGNPPMPPRGLPPAPPAPPQKVSKFGDGPSSTSDKQSKFSSKPANDLDPNEVPIGVIIQLSAGRKAYMPLQEKELPKHLPILPKGPTREIEAALTHFYAKEDPPASSSNRHRPRSPARDQGIDNRESRKDARDGKDRGRSPGKADSGRGSERREDRRDRDDKRERDRDPEKRRDERRDEKRRDERRDEKRRDERRDEKRRDERRTDREPRRDEPPRREPPRAPRPPSEGAPERAGLGAAAKHSLPPTLDTSFDSFRKRTSNFYHETGRTGQVVDSYSAREPELADERLRR